MADKNFGYVYILTNPSFREDWVKIGKSSRPVDVRSKELDNTAVPLPFEIYATMKTTKYNEVEKLVHKTIDRLTDLRIRQNREFFNVAPQLALDIFRDIAMALDDAEITEYQMETPTADTEVKMEKVQPRHERRKAFWTEFIQYCKDNDGLYANNSPVGNNWVGKSIKVPYGVNVKAVIGYDFARVEVYFNSGNKEINTNIFDYLYSRKSEIESEYGSPLIWERNDGNVTCRIQDTLACACFDMEDKTPIFEFICKASEKMSEIFHNYILDYSQEE